jgi:hypothetical protein
MKLTIEIEDWVLENLKTVLRENFPNDKPIDFWIGHAVKFWTRDFNQRMLNWHGRDEKGLQITMKDHKEKIKNGSK